MEPPQPPADDQVLHEFDYRLGRGVAMLMPLLMVAGACLFGWLSREVDEAYTVYGLRLEPEAIRLGAKAFAAAAGVLAVVLAAQAVASLRHRGRVAFTAGSLIVPVLGRLGTPTGGEIEIPFSQIRGTQVGPFVGRARVLRIWHGPARPVQLYSNLFAGRADFEAALQLLAAAVDRR